MKLNSAGQSLLESLLAIAIILIGIVSLVTLLINIIASSNSALAETRMTQLGQEALEAARYVRDSNWLKREDGITESNARLRDYANGLRATNDTTAIYLWNSASSATPDTAITFNFTPNTITQDMARVYQDSSGKFLQTASASVPSGWKITPFRRLITFQPICFDVNTTTLASAELIVTDPTKTCATTGATNQYIEIGLQVTASISWADKGTSVQRNFVEKLYNWKYADTKVLP